MRELLPVMFVIAIAAMLHFAAVSRISSSPAVEPGVSCVLEVEVVAPGVAEAEQFACASCSHAVPYLGAETEVVREPSTAFKYARGARFLANDCLHCNLRENAITSTVGTTLKLPMVAAVNVEMERDARSAARVEVEVFGAGV